MSKQHDELESTAAMERRLGITAWVLRVAESVAYGFVMGTLVYAEVWFIAWAWGAQYPPPWAWFMAWALCRALYVRSGAAAESR